ncbi:MAG TPA: type I DNA topoisomerase [Phycisphaerae bacterium]|nr:type I DNA topoisomerase [Phycisphaerae bacterium]
MAKTPRTPPPSPAPSPGAADGRRAGKALVIVESPAKAKTINKYLGSNFIVKASMGHVRDMPKGGLNVDVESNFKPTYEIIDSRKKLVGELKSAAKGVDEVYLATDLDREGEAIAWHLAQALGLDLKTAKRVVFNEITKTAILNAFKNPRLIDQHKVDAQQARRILDRLVGYKISPLLWKKVAANLSAGRVQSVALKLVVDRELEIQAFIPEEYWKLTGIFTADMMEAPALAEAWRSFLAGDQVENGEVVDDGTDSAEAILAQATESAGPTVAEKSAFLAEHAAFRADLIEVGGKKFDPKDVAAARAAADVVGLVDISVSTVDNDGTNGPRGIPNKGPATKLTKITGLADTKRSGTSFSVRELNQKISTSRPPGPFSTSTLQQAASNQLGFGAQRTMRVAQQLYEGVEIAGIGAVGLITYMRTDSQNISQDALHAVRGFIGETFGDKYLPENPNFYASKAGAQEAHEAIRPTDVALTPDSLRGRGLTDEQQRLYEVIWKRFVACQMTPAQWNVTEAIIDARKASSAVATFKATGRSLAFDGFTRVAGVYTRFDEQILPELKQNQPVAPLDLTPTQHFTSPPSRYSEASLVKALEAEGIGRPSTYASIIATIQDRQYVESKGRTLYATDLGIKVTEKLIEGFPDIMDTGFTRTIEAELDQIEEAQKDWVAVVKDFYAPLERDLATAESRMTHARAELTPSEHKCPECGAMMVYRLSKRGKRFLSCSRYPDCKGAMNVDREGKPVQLEVTDHKCPVCGKPMIKRTGRFGPFLGCSGYPECKTIQAIDKKTGEPLPPKPPPVDTGLLCPKCGKKNIVVRQGKRGPFMSCSGFPKCRTTLPAERLEEFKKSVETTGAWPADIQAKYGAGKAAAAAEGAAEETPAPKKKAAAAKKESAKKPARPKAAKTKA